MAKIWLGKIIREEAECSVFFQVIKDSTVLLSS
jgi:hypothetical protein